jgi:hypothetical protein
MYRKRLNPPKRRTTRRWTRCAHSISYFIALGGPLPEGRKPLQTLPAKAEDEAFRHTPPGVAAAADERKELESHGRQWAYPRIILAPLEIAGGRPVARLV